MWTRGWRERAWQQLEEPLDVLVVGGGITGAGIFCEAARRGLRVGLVEGSDWAWGTSSRSSKLVHGGLRYLRQGKVGLTMESVRERQRLVAEGAGLVTPLEFVLARFDGERIPGWVVGLGLGVYDLLARRWDHRKWTRAELLAREPSLRGAPVQGAWAFADAQTDDARLTLRVLREGVRAGGTAVHRARVETLLRDRRGRVCGAAVRDTVDEVDRELRASVVINATGAWADRLRTQVGGTRRLRGIRGSHLVFAGDRLPVGRAVSLLHPRTRRGVFAVPWEGVTLVGTTDVDHTPDLDDEPVIDASEWRFLMEAAQHAFPGAELSDDDVLCTWSGVRPVIDTGAADPSKESREHALWDEHGLITVSGGKLTTFRAIAEQVLAAAASRLPERGRDPWVGPVLLGAADPAALDDLDPAVAARLLGRLGEEAVEMVTALGTDALRPIANTPATWAELRWAARTEGITHLDDLLLRRVRVGLLTAGAARDLLDEVQQVAAPELGWSEARWSDERARYLKAHAAAYDRPATPGR